MHSKTGVSTEDNPAYGVSLNTPQRATAIHQASSAVQEESKFQSRKNPSGQVDLVV